MPRATPQVAVWGAGTPLATALAEGLRQHDLEAVCIATLRRRPAHRTVVFPVWDGRAAEPHAERRARLLEEAGTLLDALADGRLEQLIVISSSAAYGGGAQRESDPLAAAEGETFAADAVAVETLLGTAGGAAGSPPHPGLTVLRAALLLGDGCETSLLARHLAGPRLLVVRGSVPRWQICHTDDLCGALASVLGGSVPDWPAVVASAGVLDETALELASGRKRMELPLRVAEATAARLRRTRLSPAAPEELALLTRPVVVEPLLLTALGWRPRRDAAEVVRAHVADTASSAGEASSSLPSAPQAVTLAGATVAVVGSAALLRRARRQRGMRTS